MQNRKMTAAVLASTLVLTGFSARSMAAIVISEVDAAGSATTSYGADWYELTNTGSSAVDITGWKMDDNSDSFALAVPLRGITSIPAGKSVVFLEGNSTGTTDATIDANFETAWFGSSVPAGFLVANYGGSGVGLSQTSDAVNIFDAVGDAIAGVDFNASTLGQTFDNSAGVTNDGVISTFSQVGVNGAFTSANGQEVGSPGIANVAVPEPASMGLVLTAAGLIGRRKRTA